MKILQAIGIVIFSLSPVYIYAQITFGIQTCIAVNNSNPSPKSYFLPVIKSNFTFTYQREMTFIKLDYSHGNSQSFIVDGKLNETVFSYYSCSVGRIVSRKIDNIQNTLYPKLRWNIGFELKDINSYDNSIVSPSNLQQGMRFGFVGELTLSVPINNYLAVNCGLNSQVDVWKWFTYNLPNQIFLDHDAIFFQIDINIKELLSS